MLRFIMTMACIVLLCGSVGAESINIQEMVFCRSIEDREPVEPDSLFNDTVGQIYCYTKVTSVTDTTSIFHVWFHENEEKAKVELVIGSSPWRTWSSKLILKEWTGIWRVDIQLPNGRLIRSKEFLVKPSE